MPEVQRNRATEAYARMKAEEERLISGVMGRKQKAPLTCRNRRPSMPKEEELTAMEHAAMIKQLVADAIRESNSPQDVGALSRDVSGFTSFWRSRSIN